MKKSILIWLLCCFFATVRAQTDSIGNAPILTDKSQGRLPVHSKPVQSRMDSSNVAMTKDTAHVANTIGKRSNGSLSIDSIVSLAIDTSKQTVKAITTHPIDSFYQKLLNNPFFRTTQRPLYLLINERKSRSKDEMFYLLIGMIFLLAVIKLLFDQYFTNLFRQFFQPAFRQKQIREQLSQNNFPSLLLNVFFIISASAFVALLMQYYRLSAANFKVIFFYSAFALLVLYAGKFLLLTFAGWVFNVRDTVDTYIFIVFLVNKVAGIVLLPFCFIIAFAQPGIIAVAVILSIMLVSLLFLSRYIAAASPVFKEIKISLSHFVFYIFAFEITPLLIIYKSLGIYLTKGT